MENTSTPGSLPLDHLGALHDQARRRAHALRREAIDDFWRGADAALVASLSSARQGAERLAYRLARHVRSRHRGLEG